MDESSRRSEAPGGTRARPGGARLARRVRRARHHGSTSSTPGRSTARALTKADLATIANAVNDDGFQYATRDEASRIRRELEGVVKKLGGPAGLEVASVQQSVKTERISDTDTFRAQAWTLRNPRANDAITITIRKGSL